MANVKSNKMINNLRPMYVKEILLDHTDENHFITVNEILELLDAEYGITSTRKTLYEDIDLLLSVGLDIECIKGRQNKYHMLSRDFDIAEIRLLIDSVESLKSLPLCKSRELVRKLSRLGGPSADFLVQSGNAELYPRAENTQIYYIIDSICNAIASRKQIGFKYYEYLTSSNKVLKNNGKEYQVSPYRLVCCNEYYYLLGYTKEQLDLDTESIQAVAKGRHCQMAVLKWQQADGLNTALPFGVRKIDCFRTLNTESLAVFLPFKTQEIMDKGGIYYGENAISHNLIMCNKENLLNQSAFLLGVPGSGKSFSAKELITFLMLNTDDDILICDPEGEYAPLVEAMGPDMGSVIRVSAGGRDRLNAMYMVDGYGENDPIVVKSQFIMSLVEQIDKKGVGPQQKSIIDRCAAAVYREAEKLKSSGGATPTLCTFREKLLQQPEREAKQIALSLELFTTGSLDIFGRESSG